MANPGDDTIPQTCPKKPLFFSIFQIRQISAIGVIRVSFLVPVHPVSMKGKQDEVC